LSEWAKLCRPIVRRGVKLFVYVNNHYSGTGFITAEQFRELWKGAAKGRRGSAPNREIGSLFD
jgi:uncharacterized protein YecE (DUF72 family)